MSEMKLDEAIEYLTSLKGGGIEPGLSRIRDLLEIMGNPQDSLRFVHIAGTNGKGSTLAFIAGVLLEAGYRVGTYTSPAVFDYRERFRTGKKSLRNITGNELVRGVTTVRAAVLEMEKRGVDTPSSFEAETALAFWYLKEKNCDIVVLETGMGGDEDATNVIGAPLAAVITSIGYDHMAFLGDSLDRIAAKKAGIIKKGCTVVTGSLPEEAERVIRKRAEDLSCGYITINKEAIRDRKVRKDSFRQVFDYGAFRKLCIGPAGKYQLGNAALAVETVLALREKGIVVSDEAIYRGLETVKWPGRFEKISDRPIIVTDGAHNEEAAVKLRESIDFYFTNRHIIYIMGMLKDKEYDRVCEIMGDAADAVFTVSTPGARSLSAIELAGTMKRYNPNVTAADSSEEALELAGLMAGREGVIIIFGSLSFLRNITEFAKKWIRKR